MSLLGKYRKEEERKSDSEDTAKTSVEASPETQADKSEETLVSVPNKMRKSPIVSFSIPTDLRTCLQAVRNKKAINLSMWVEHKLREAVTEEFPEIASEHLDS